MLGPSRPARIPLSTSDLWRSAHSEEAVLRHRHRTRQSLRDHFSRPWPTIAHREPGSPTHRPNGCHSSQTGRTTWPRKRTESRQVEAQFGFSFSPVMLLAILGRIEMALGRANQAVVSAESGSTGIDSTRRGQGNVSRASITRKQEVGPGAGWAGRSTSHLPTIRSEPHFHE